ncbi:hypothetical protein [sulfur-oxidizing endosymbiont of Gigantopelta aegis]|uniref:hypothetical protein n=1 Tax=sulfur-oxidizing endosymbiont of Gigantopelta aegis TaxID=2794934 RepID=UPI001BE3D3D4|nr:hypothetical protein [sulfur-oxidizing endosymbiont of Gigantopelta aegis]
MLRCYHDLIGDQLNVRKQAIGFNYSNTQTENGEIFFQAVNKSNGVYTFLREDRPAALSPVEVDKYKYNNINFPGWYRKGDSDNFQAIYDNIYVAIGPNHVARIELTDSPVYADSTKLFTVPYEKWTDNEITINVKTADLRNINRLYLYVVDKFNNRSEKGISLEDLRDRKLDFIILKILNSSHR